MKILHVITSLRTGGAEKLMVDLLPRFRKLGDDVELLLFDGERTPFYEQLEQSGVTIHKLGINRNVYNPLNIFGLFRYMRKYDIVHSHLTAPQLFAAIGSLFCSTILCTTEHATSNRRRTFKLYSYIDKWMYSRYKKIICISDGTENSLCSYVRGRIPTSTCVIYNGVDIVKYVDALPIKENSLLDLTKHYFIIMMVAGFRPAKDQDTLIRALTHLPYNFHAFFVGDGIRKSECEKLADSLKVRERCHFLGVRGDVPSLMKIANVVVISSHWEGFGLAAVEGMASGRPVIASDLDGLREVVQGAGVMFEPRDALQLAHEIERLSNDENYYHMIKEKCIKRAMMYDISKMVEGYQKVYQEIIS